MELLLLLNNRLEEPSDLLFFFGRLHPLFVHLPIGFLILAVIAHFTAKKQKFQPIKVFVPYLWGLGAISALLAVVFGYLLSLTGNYDEDTIFWHKWSGVAVLLLSIACYYTSRKSGKLHFLSNTIFVLLLVTAVFITGHLGGNLTHGSRYLLEYAPNSIRSLAGMPPKKAKRKKVTELDSADIFLDVISPILHSKCTGCHNQEKKKGKLVLTSFNSIMKGGENGEVVIPEEVLASELFRRITLPEEHDDFMPSEGKRPLTDQEVDLIEWWINSGARPQGYVMQMNPEKIIVAAVENYLGLDKNKIINRKTSPPDEFTLDSLTTQGFVINALMRDNYLLDANFSLSENILLDKDLNLLLKIKEQLIWLDLSNSEVEDVHLEKIGLLENLIKLDLSGNTITDKGLEHLAQLSNLELLNLYNTGVSEEVLRVLPKMPALKTVYLWQTKVSDTAMARLIKENSHLKVISKREQ